jgi:Domain of Unknown Function (DUF1080)
MRPEFRPLSLAAFACVFAIAFVARGDDDATTAADEQGFVKLFNGKDLTGWVYGEKHQGKGYQVKDGVLFCPEDGGGNLFTEKEYSDFVFRFEFKLQDSGNNGVGIRAPLKGDAAYVGMEIQILDDNGKDWKGKLRPEQYHGSIYDVVPAKRGSLKPAGEWNSEEIIARGRQITVKLNGNTIVDANLDDIKDEKVLQKHPGLKRDKGHIGFLGHGSHVEFRNIRVKELK